MRQIVYASISSAPPGRADLDAILHASRHNNAIDGITGLLWSDRTRFIQALEGPEDSVAAAFERIGADPRHHSVAVLSDRAVTEREFGTWNMAARLPGDSGDAYDDRLRRLLLGAPAAVQAHFRDFVTG